MLNRLKSVFSAPAAALGLASVTMLSGSAFAEDAPTVTPISSAATITHEQELTLLRQASDDSRLHAMDGFNIGLVLHVGDDIAPQQLEIVTDYFRNHYQTALDDAYPDQGGQVQIFPRPNPGSRSSLLSVNIGRDLFQVDNAKYGRTQGQDPALLDIQTGIDAVGDVLEVLPAAKAVQLQNETMQTASLTDHAPG